MKKKRLLVTISFSFSIRYLIRTKLIEKLRTFCDPVIAIYWNEEDLITELRANGFEVVLIPPAETSIRYNDCRKKINYWFNYHNLRNNSRLIDSYMERRLAINNRLMKRLRCQFNVVKYSFFLSEEKLFHNERKMLQTETNFSFYLDWLLQLNIDAVYTVTPFHKQEDLLLRAAKGLGLKMIASILSFDNTTKRGWMAVIYDQYLVWNEQNKRELLYLYRDLKPENICITGAAQFDFYFDPANLMSREEWKSVNNIPSPDRPVLFYSGGAADLFPQEIQYVQDLINAVKSEKIADRPLILFRSHPADSVTKWRTAFQNSADIILQNSWGSGKQYLYSNLTDFDIVNLCSTLAYTDVHISLCSTMTVDGSAFDKPQLAPYYDRIHRKDQKPLRGLFEQLHYKKIMESGGLTLVRKPEDWRAAINQSLHNPKREASERNRILQEIISFTDGKSTQRVAESIQHFLISEKETAVF